VLIAMLDTHRTMTMDFEGFKQIHGALESWKQCFRHFDADASGTCEHEELKAIFKYMKFNVSDAATDVCVKRYSKRATGQVGTLFALLRMLAQATMLTLRPQQILYSRNRSRSMILSAAQCGYGRTPRHLKRGTLPSKEQLRSSVCLPRHAPIQTYDFQSISLFEKTILLCDADMILYCAMWC
jgi:hypothetical protein